MMFDSPPAMVYEIPESNFAVASTQIEQQQRLPISVMAFGMADPNLGVYEDNTSVHFYDHFTNTMNATLVSKKKANLQYSSMILWHSGKSSIVVEFNLEEKHLTDGLGLYLTHLSSDLHRGTYDSAIRMKVNGQNYVEKYVPASHDWIADDRFDLTPLVRNKTLHAGKNRLEIQLHESAVSNYWIHCIIIK